MRCAIYTRKSTEERLDMHFNSLEAQSDACRAYIASQSHANWLPMDEEFSDPGFSGGTLDRPSLQKLLKLIEGGKIDIVVVHKVDRLTRSLSDFAKLNELFERHNVSFVSVTQHLDTSNSMGRLSLHVLLSFAQFEREIASERIKEKIAASRRRGLWTGGVVPLGFKSVDKQLVVVPPMANFVCYLYERYRTLESVSDLVLELEAYPKRGKQSREIQKLKSVGKLPGRGSLYNLLRNPIYIGKIRCGDELVDGIHPSIVDQDLFDQVQSVLNKPGFRSKQAPGKNNPDNFVGKIFDGEGERLTRSHTRKNCGTRYTYYVSAVSTRGRKAKAKYRISCERFHQIVAKHVLSNLREFMSTEKGLQGEFSRVIKRAKFKDTDSYWPSEGYDLEAIRAVSCIQISSSDLTVSYDALLLANSIAKSPKTSAAVDQLIRTITIPKAVVFQGSCRAKTQVLRHSPSPEEAQKRGKEWFALLANGKATNMYEIADRYGVTQPTVSRMISRALGT